MEEVTGEFSGKADLVYIDSIRWVLHSDLSYTTVAGDTIMVTRGFNTDLGTIPRVLWSFLAPFEVTRPAIIHDYLYVHLERHSDTFKANKKYADDTFYEAMLAEHNISRLKAKIAYYAVRLLGGRF